MVTRGREQFSSSGHGAGVSDSTVPIWRRKAEGERSLGIQRCGFPFLDRTGLRAHLHTRPGHEATARLLLEKAANVATSQRALVGVICCLGLRTPQRRAAPPSSPSVSHSQELSESVQVQVAPTPATGTVTTPSPSTRAEVDEEGRC